MQDIKYDTNGLQTHRHKKQIYGYERERKWGRDQLRVWN